MTCVPIAPDQRINERAAQSGLSWANAPVEGLSATVGFGSRGHPRACGWIPVGFAAVVCCAFAMSLATTPACAQNVDPNLWGTDGAVDAIVRAGNTIYVGGSFTAVGPNSGGGAPLDRQTGVPIVSFPRVTGVVNAVIGDGSNGWYIGGSFVAVGGLPRLNLAHVLADGRVADWTPNADAEVLALARRGQSLYVGGFFTHVGGQTRSHIAEVDGASGQATSWNPAADLQVRVLLIDAGRLYVGGDFSTIGGQPRSRVAELDIGSAQATSWNPDLGVGLCSVRALAALNDTIYIGGDFSSVGGVERLHLAAVSATTGLVTGWNPTVTGPNDSSYGDPLVSALAVRGNTILVGGHFTGIGGQARGGLAQIDLATGSATAWDPLDAGAADIAVLVPDDSTLFVGGDFTFIGGQARQFCAELKLDTGLATSWSPRPNDPARAVAVSRSVVYVGGVFTSIGSQWVQRGGLAAFDATTGAVKEWDPSPDGFFVGALATAKGQVFVGGYFATIGGQSRSGLAALDTLTGAVTAWDPQPNGVVSSLAVAGDTLFVGGYFTAIGAAARSHLASFDLNSGALTSWDPSANDNVFGLALSPGRVYIAGFFSAVGGVARRYGAAAVDAITGAVTDWNPQSDNWVNAIAVVDSVVIVGGTFSTIGGQPRSNLAALDPTTGQATPWVANTNSQVYAVTTIGDTLFAAGSFFTIGGQARSGLAALDVATGAVLPWDPGLSSVEWASSLPRPVVYSLGVDGSVLYAGGLFGRLGESLATSLACVSFGGPTGPRPVPVSLSLAPPMPNPMRGGGMLRFSLPRAGPVTLRVFDIQGRRVSTLLNNVTRPAGINAVSMRTEGWGEGFYFCRLDAWGASAVQKLVVLK